LGNDASLPVTKEQAKAAIESMGLSATIRGEALSLAQFAELANRLKEA
jgi:ribosomal RNA small subunit methyltransferase A